MPCTWRKPLTLLSMTLYVPCLAQDQVDPVRFSESVSLFPCIDLGTNGCWPDFPIAVDVGAGACASLSISMDGSAIMTNDGALNLRYVGQPGNGQAAMDIGFDYRACVCLDVYIYQNRWCLAEADFRFQDSTFFSPFLLPGSTDRPAELSDRILSERLFHIDLTDALIPIPGIGGFFILDVTGQLDIAFRGNSIQAPDSGAEILIEGGSFTFPIPSSGNLVIDTLWQGTAQVTGSAVFLPDLCIEIPFVGDWCISDFVPTPEIPLSIPTPELPLTLGPDTASFIVNPASGIQVSGLSLSPGTVNPFEPVRVTGSASYDVGGQVRTGTATINVANGGMWTAPVVEGSFDRMIQAPANATTTTVTRTVTVSVSDGSVSTGVASAPLSVRGTDTAGGSYIFDRATTCLDVGSADPFPCLGEKACFSRDDGRVYVWVHLEDLFVPVKVRWDFFRPNGSSFAPVISDWTADPQASGFDWWFDWWFWAWLPIQGTSNADAEGVWRTEVSVTTNGVSFQYLATAEYTIVSDFQEHRMCHDAGGPPNFDCVGPANTFFTDDTRALTWAQTVNASDPLSVKWVYFSPEGFYDQFLHVTDDPASEGFDCYDWVKFWGWINIAGTPAALECGDWHVDVFIKDAFGSDELIYTDVFALFERPAESPNVTVSLNPAELIEGQGISLSVGASDNNHLAKVTLHIDGAIAPTWEAVNASTFATSHVTAPRSEGATLRFWAEAWDESGNHGTSEQREVKVGDSDTAGPNIGCVVVQEAIGNGDGVLQACEKVQLSFCIDDPSGVADVALQLDGSGVTVSGNAAVLGPFCGGFKQFRITATDGDMSPATATLEGSFFVAPRFGDTNLDCDTDLEDWTSLYSCVNGPGESISETRCIGVDSDGDGNIDLRDIAGLFVSWRPAGCPCSTSADCDDGVFCNGAEACFSGVCVSGVIPCPDDGCNEDLRMCGHIVYDNGPIVDGAGVGFGSTITADDFVLSFPTTIFGVQLSAFHTTGGSLGQNVEWWIWDDAGGVPGLVVQSGIGQNVTISNRRPRIPPPLDDLVYFDVAFGLGTLVELSQGRSYWFGITSPGGVSPPGLAWRAVVGSTGAYVHRGTKKTDWVEVTVDGGFELWGFESP